ncbi:sugar transferase [Mesobacillus harenae]|uniref:sugar transferase n=1 Tax=Mesobacillus harenae TaxID=2213203 RepID=UPI00158050E2|nr:sugar transferase [Mesobacillus harenae]
MKSCYIGFKRVIDFIFALIFLVLSLPIMVSSCIAIKLESRGPIFFKQPRPGKNGEIFVVYKFRTMRVETMRDGTTLTNMQRITRVGSLLRKTSIDELPQMVNILRGEMSFIGPRPLLIQYLNHYSAEEMRRHEVLPGISGWAQVNGRNAISWEEKFKLDVWYVDHLSLVLDLKILLKTIQNVLARKGVNSSSEDTMPYFSGKKETAN